MVCRWRRVLKRHFPNENLTSGGGYTSLFIDSYLKNFHVKRNALSILARSQGSWGSVGVGRGGWGGLGLRMRGRKDKHGAERTEGWGAAVLREGESASFCTPIFCHRGCRGETVPCCTSLITTTITHTRPDSTCFTFPACINRIKSVCFQMPTIFSSSIQFADISRPLSPSVGCPLSPLPL